MSARFDSREVAIALVGGLLFGAGLVISGMTDPTKVIGFLDLSGDWNPVLGFVLLGATGTHLLSRPLLRRLAPEAVSAGTPQCGVVDRPLLVGSALFGAGWGLSGYCPGPALTATLPSMGTTLAFTAAMLGGMALYQLRVNAAARPAPSAPAPEASQ